MRFGIWIRRHNPKSEVPEIATLLDSRFKQGNQLPLTFPEYAVLGLNYFRFAILNQAWVQKHKAKIFPHQNFLAWRSAFSAFIRYIGPGDLAYRYMEEEYQFALENLAQLMPESQEQEHRTNEVIDSLGQHLFMYYLLDVYPLNGETSLLAQFYKKTKDNPGYWKNLFSHVGYLLRNAEKDLERDIATKAKDFIEWRVSKRNIEELEGFFECLDAECLPAGWRLDVFSQILDIRQLGFGEVKRGVNALAEMLEEHPGKVVECLAKITDLLPVHDSFYIYITKAQKILKFGLNSDDQNTRQHAEYAQEKLLRHGYSDFLQLDD